MITPILPTSQAYSQAIRFQHIDIIYYFSKMGKWELPSIHSRARDMPSRIAPEKSSRAYIYGFILPHSQKAKKSEGVRELASLDGPSKGREHGRIA